MRPCPFPEYDQPEKMPLAPKTIFEVRDILQHILSFMFLPVQNIPVKHRDLMSVLTSCRAFHFALINYDGFQKRFQLCLSIYEVMTEWHIPRECDRAISKHLFGIFKISGEKESLFKKLFLSVNRYRISYVEDEISDSCNFIAWTNSEFAQVSMTDSKKFSKICNNRYHREEIFQAIEKLKKCRMIFSIKPLGTQLLLTLLFCAALAVICLYALDQFVRLSFQLANDTSEKDKPFLIILFPAVGFLFVLAAAHVSCAMSALLKDLFQKYQNNHNHPVFSEHDIGKKYEACCRFFNKAATLVKMIGEHAETVILQ